MSEYTTDNLNLNKPTSGSTTWGDDVNANWDTIDQEITDHSSHLESLDTDSNTQANELIHMTALQKANTYPNIILNGEFAVDQDDKGEITTAEGSAYYTDGYKLISTLASVYSAGIDLNNKVIPGYKHCLGIQTLSAQTFDSTTNVYGLEAPIEGTRCSELRWGTAKAKPAILSFVAEHSHAGTYGIAIKNGGNNRTFASTYTISESEINVPVIKSIVVAGDTGTDATSWPVNESAGMKVYIPFGISTNYQTSTTDAWQDGNYHSPEGVDFVTETLGATFYITGIQMYPLDYKLLNGQLVDYTSSEGEIYPVVRDYIHKNYDDDLWDCQKWACWLERGHFASSAGFQSSSTVIYETFALPRYMPNYNGIIVDTVPSAWDWDAVGLYTVNAGPYVDGHDNTHMRLSLSVTGGATAHTAGFLNFKIFVDGRL